MLLWADGFDHYGTAANMTANAYSAASNTEASILHANADDARTGPYCLLCSTVNNGTVELLKLLGGPVTSIGFGFGLMIARGGIPSDRRARVNIGLTDGGGNLIFSLFPQSDNSIGISMGAGTYNDAFASSAPGVLIQDQYVWIEANVFLDPVAGGIEVRVNDVPVILQTDLNLGAGAYGFRINKATEVNSGWGNTSVYIDDFVMWDLAGDLNNDFFGKITRCRTLFPASNVDPQDWQVTGGTAWQLLGNVPVNFSDNIAGASVGDVSAFGLPFLPNNVSYVRGFSLIFAAERSEATLAGFTPSLAVRDYVATGSEIIPAAAPSWLYYNSIIEADPVNQGYWSLDDARAAIANLERTS